MANIKFDIGEPYFEFDKDIFRINIEKIDFENQEIDIKYIYMYKKFWFFELPKLGVPRVSGRKNSSAMEWLRLYAKTLRKKYEQGWENQPKELILEKVEGLPTLQYLIDLEV